MNISISLNYLSNKEFNIKCNDYQMSKFILCIKKNMASLYLIIKIKHFEIISVWFNIMISANEKIESYDPPIELIIILPGAV